MSDVISLFKSLRARSQVFALLMLFLCFLVVDESPSVLFVVCIRVVCLIVVMMAKWFDDSAC